MKRLRYILLTLAVGAVCFECGWIAGNDKMQAVQVIRTQEIAVDPMAQYRREREQLRAMQRAQLNEMIHDGQTEDAIRSAAQRQLLDMNEAEAAETNIEGMLCMRGWSECVAAVQGDGVNVLLEDEMITRQESSLILELVCRETGIQPGNVKIIPVNSPK